MSKINSEWREQCCRKREDCEQTEPDLHGSREKASFPQHREAGLPLRLQCERPGKESACNARDLGSIPGLGSSPEEGKGYPFQYSGLENSMDCIDHGNANSWT